MTKPRDWYRDARVRSSARPSSPPQGDGSAWFLVDLQPHVRHPIVLRRAPDSEPELLRRALARYLHGTSVLEIRIVNEVAAELAHGALGRELPASTRLEALQLFCDEAYHAILATELLGQIGAGVKLLAPAFEGRLAALCQRHAGDDDEARWLRFLFTVVTETAISASMHGLARSTEIARPVRQFVADHAHDEAWHAAYFSSLFALFWPRLPASEQARYGALLPDLVTAFLAPDTGAIAGDLDESGLSPDEVAIVLGEAYSPAAQRQGIARAARPVLACFRRAGALVGETLHAFHSAGLLAQEI